MTAGEKRGKNTVAGAVGSSTLGMTSGLAQLSRRDEPTTGQKARRLLNDCPRFPIV